MSPERRLSQQLGLPASTGPTSVATRRSGATDRFQEPSYTSKGFWFAPARRFHR
jgi:hypothetical protein